MKSKTLYTKRDLIVTLACIAFLTANLAAIGAAGRRRAKEAICLSNLRQWGAAYEFFTNDNSGRVTASWIFDLYPYYKDINLLLCPSAIKKGTIDVRGLGRIRGSKFEAWFMPDARLPDGSQRDILSSYGSNGFVGSTGFAETPSETDWTTVDIKGADKAPALLDAAVGGSVPLPMDEPPEYDGQIYMSNPMDVNEIRSFCINRHSGGVNCLFLDFSARKVGLKELWVLEWHRGWPCLRGTCHGLPVWPPWMNKFKDYERPPN